MWLLSDRDVIDVMTRHGYQLVFRSLLERVHDQENFDPAWRLPGGHPSAFLFVRQV
jgi:hypothetical protein